jgi:hypothetical protein
MAGRRGPERDVDQDAVTQEDADFAAGMEEEAEVIPSQAIETEVQREPEQRGYR